MQFRATKTWDKLNVNIDHVYYADIMKQNMWKKFKADYCTLGYHSISAQYQKYFSVFGSIFFFLLDLYRPFLKQQITLVPLFH